MAEIKKAFDPGDTGRCQIKLIAQRIGPLEVADARNEMFKAKGGGTPTTYLFNVVEFAVDWKQDGTMQNQVPFTMEAKGKLVFAIEAGVLLSSDVEAKITIKPVQTQDENGQAMTVSGGGTCTMRNSLEPINWTRGVRRREGKATAARVADPAPDKPTDAGSARPDSMSTPAGSIAYQLDQLKKGNIEALKECFAKDIRDRITDATVQAGQENAKGVSLEDLVGEVIESEGLGSSRTAKIKMKNGRTLTTLVLTDGKWLAETVWFK